MHIFTIGVYNSTEQDFFNKLTQYKISVFCDVRLRRGVRGSKYSFVNSKRLQSRLSELGIVYIHAIDLAPSKEIRGLQKKADSENKELKRDREFLGDAFSQKYRDEVLSKFDLKSWIGKLENEGAKNIALFCVEEKATACHRSLISEYLSEKMGYQVTNI